MTSSGRSQFASNYELCPIILVGGIAANVQGGKMLVTQLLQTETVQESDLSEAQAPFARFRPVPGGELIANEVGHYAFANQSVAANAIIVNPLRFSMLMTCPAQGDGGWSLKTAIMTNLSASLRQHCAQGGYFIVATPAMQYDSALLLTLRDVSGGESNQPQYMFQWDFEQPLLTQQQAAQSLNSLLSKIDSGTRVNVDSNGAISWSGLNNSQGAPGTAASPPNAPSTALKSASLTTLRSPPSYSQAAP